MKKRIFSVLLTALTVVALVAALSVSVSAEEPHYVASVGSTSYETIDEAIANWTNNTTLTLLDNVTLSSTVMLSSTENHTLNLGQYTMTAASGQNAIEIVCNGRSSASYTLTVNADSANPGGITATGKACIYYKKSGSTKDRPIITINGGIFNGSYSINCTSNGNTNCPQFRLNGGTYQGNVNLTKTMLIVSGGTFNGWVNCTGDQNAYRQITGGSFKTWQFMTTGVDKFAVGMPQRNTTPVTPAKYDVGLYVDDNGYLVVGGPVITEPGTTYDVSSAATVWNSLLTYSSATKYGPDANGEYTKNVLFWTDIYTAMAKKTTGVFTVYTDSVDLRNAANFKGTFVLPFEDSRFAVTYAEGSAPAFKVTSAVSGKTVVYTESVAGGVVTRTYYPISLTVNGNGTVAVGETTEANKTALVATPKDGNYFVNWVVGGVDAGDAETYTIDAFSTATIVANFAAKTSEELPTAVFTKPDTLTALVPGAAYTVTVDGTPAEYTADENGVLDVDGSWYGKSISIVKKASDKTKSDSDAQTITLPARLAGTFTVTGTVKVGETLTASLTDNNNTGNLSYAWFRSAESDTQINGAEGGTYTLTEADIGYAIYCVVKSDVEIGDIKSAATVVVPLIVFPDGSIASEGYTGVYDKAAHSITVTAPDGAEVLYSTDGTSYAAEKPSFTEAGEYTVYYRVQRENYESVNGSAAVSIGQKELALTWSELTATDLVYDGAANTLTVTVSGIIDGDSCAVTTALVGNNVNVGTFSYTITAIDNDNYKLPANVNSPEYTVTPKAVTITADSFVFYEYSAMPELTYSVAGLVDGESLVTEPTVTTNANMNHYGEYAIVVNGADAGANYAITYVNGTLTVKAKVHVSVVVPAFEVDVAESVGGKITANNTTASEGDAVTLTIATTDGYTFDTITVADSFGTAIALTKVSETEYSFVMPGANVKISATFIKTEAACDGKTDCPVTEYEDLDVDEWYHDAIHYCVDNGLMIGVAEDEFAPEMETSRAMIVTVLWRMSGAPAVDQALTFEDVADDAWYAAAVRWAYSTGIIKGYSDTVFAPDDAITLEQMATILHRYEQYKGANAAVAVNDTAELDGVSAWAKDAMSWMMDTELSKFNPNETVESTDKITRAEVASIFYIYCEKVTK